MSRSNHPSSGRSRRLSLPSAPPEPVPAHRPSIYASHQGRTHEPRASGSTPTGSGGSTSQSQPRYNPAHIARPSSARPDLASSSYHGSSSTTIRPRSGTPSSDSSTIRPHPAPVYSPGTHYSRLISSSLSPFQDSSNCPLPRLHHSPEVEEYSPLIIQPSRLVLGSRYPSSIPRPTSAQSRPQFTPGSFPSSPVWPDQPASPVPEVVKRLIRYLQRRIFICSDINCGCKRTCDSSGQAYSVWSIEREVEFGPDSRRGRCVPVGVVLESHDRHLNYDTRISGGTSYHHQPIAPYDVYHGPADYLHIESVTEGGAHRAAEALKSNNRNSHAYAPLRSYISVLRPTQGIITPKIVDREGQPPALMNVRSYVWGTPGFPESDSSSQSRPSMSSIRPWAPMQSSSSRRPPNPPPPSRYHTHNHQTMPGYMEQVLVSRSRPTSYTTPSLGPMQQSPAHQTTHDAGRPRPRPSRSSSLSRPTSHNTQPHVTPPPRPMSAFLQPPSTSAAPLLTSLAARSDSASSSRPASGSSRPSLGSLFNSSMFGSQKKDKGKGREL